MKSHDLIAGPQGPGLVLATVADRPRIDLTSELSLHPDLRVEGGYPDRDGSGPRVRYIALTEAQEDATRAA